MWWDTNCDKATQKRRQHIRELWNNFTEENYINIKRITAQTIKLLKENFRTFCNNLEKHPLNKYGSVKAFGKAQPNTIGAPVTTMDPTRNTSPKY